MQLGGLPSREEMHKAFGIAPFTYQSVRYVPYVPRYRA